jgi:FtsZ-binding cell division protein ZapB
LKLYDLTEKIHALINDADDPENEKLAQEIADEIESTQEALETKLENYASVVRELEGNENKLKAEKSRFDERMKAVRGQKERMKGMMTQALRLVPTDAKGVHRVKGERFHLYLANNPPSVDTDNCDIAKIPDEFIHFEPKILSRDILTLLKQTGEIPPGVVLKAPTKSVRIR